MTRDERQALSVQRWIDNKCRGVMVLSTGFGKTFVSMLCIKRLRAKNPAATVMVVVPSDVLKSQWIKELVIHGVEANVVILNTASKNNYNVDLLIIDEIHKSLSQTFINIYSNIKFKVFLGLTATLSRLDNRDLMLTNKIPIIDKVSAREAIKNGWLSNYTEYKVLLDVDLTEYKEAHKEFLRYFSFFNYDFKLAMDCVTDFNIRDKFARAISKCPAEMYENRKIITANAFGFKNMLHKRKNFVMSHPKKIEIANLILEHRKDKKAITFSSTIKMAEQIKYGGILHSGIKKKKRAISVDEFNSMPCGVLNSSKCLIEGFDSKGVNLSIMMSTNSSQTTKAQSIGRIIRKEGDKHAESFTLLIAGTVEENWYSKSTKTDHITINEEQLMKVLKYEDFEEVEDNEVLVDDFYRL